MRLAIAFALVFTALVACGGKLVDEVVAKRVVGTEQGPPAYDPPSDEPALVPVTGSSGSDRDGGQDAGSHDAARPDAS
jgi:hypothetical protein